jgi:hypothetical protein
MQNRKLTKKMQLKLMQNHNQSQSQNGGFSFRIPALQSPQQFHPQSPIEFPFHDKDESWQLRSLVENHLNDNLKVLLYLIDADKLKQVQNIISGRSFKKQLQNTKKHNSHKSHRTRIHYPVRHLQHVGSRLIKPHDVINMQLPMQPNQLQLIQNSKYLKELQKAMRKPKVKHINTHNKMENIENITNNQPSSVESNNLVEVIP